jgi:hypothetical protein
VVGGNVLFNTHGGVAVPRDSILGRTTSAGSLHSRARSGSSSKMSSTVSKVKREVSGNNRVLGNFCEW